MSAVETCKNGHPRTPENTGVRGGVRVCRECERERQRRSRAKFAGQPCRGCGREGLALDGGRHCSRCLTRKRRGQPLDGPPMRTPRLPAPDVAPKPPKGSRLPKGWFDTTPKPVKGKRGPRQQASIAKAMPEIGPIPVIAPEVSARCLRLLTRHDADDLAVMLGVADEEPAADRPQGDPTAKGRAIMVQSRHEKTAAWLAEVDAVVAELGHDGRAVAARLGYRGFGDFAVRLRRLGRRELADALKPPDMRGRTRAIARNPNAQPAPRRKS